MRTERNSFPDWEAIQEVYEAGGLSNRKIAKRFGVTEGAIRKKAKAENWIKPKRGRTAIGAHQQLPALTSPQSSAHAASDTIRELADVDPKDLVKRGLRIILKLMTELEAIGETIDDIEDAIIDETSGDQNSRRRNAMLKAVSHPVRTQAAKNLATALSTLQQSGPGKKERAQDAAQTAGQGSEWGDDLAVDIATAN